MQGGHVALFTIFLGANDAVAADWTDEKGQPIKTQHVPIPRYTANLTRMVAMLRQHQPQAEIVIIAPPKVHVGRGNNPVAVEVFLF
jgi:lysophospholipase L1-like esterase